jgi:hypothetical protein
MKDHRAVFPAAAHMDRIIKASVAIGILLIGISACYYFIFFLPGIQRQRLAEQVARTILEQDQKCSKGAKEYFDGGSWASKDTIGWYENHFNPRLNRCYIHVRSNMSLGNAFFYYQLLADVNDGKTIAQYDKQVPTGTADYIVKPFVCDMLEKYCKSDEEFDAFVKTYMEQ